jgi:hypothetical protein
MSIAKLMLGLVCVLAAAQVGCGGKDKSPSDKAQVVTVLQSFLKAQTGGDGQAACPLLTAAGQNKLVTLVAEQAPSLGTRPTCEDAVGLIRAVAPPALLKALGTARVEHVRVTGDTATADVVDGAAFPTQHVVLRKADATWRINDVPGLRL